MSRKSSLPQDPKSVSVVLTPDRNVNQGQPNRLTIINYFLDHRRTKVLVPVHSDGSSQLFIGGARRLFEGCNTFCWPTLLLSDCVKPGKEIVVFWMFAVFLPWTYPVSVDS